MSAQILDLNTAIRSARITRASDHQYGPCQDTDQATQAGCGFIEHFEFWSGASKERYVHTVYNLIDCPELPQANFMLVHRATDGSRSILQIGHTPCKTGSENLAMIRHSAAVLGANEVHVHFLPASDKARELVEFDLRAGQFGSLSPEPANLLH